MENSIERTILEAHISALIGREPFRYSLRLPLHASTILMGPAASGKTTFLRSISGLIKDVYGFIRCGERIFLDSDKKVTLPVHKRKIGFVFQDPALFPFMSVKKNLDYSIRRNREGMPCTAKSGWHPEEIFAMLELDGLLGKPVQSLSGGEKQRVAIGRSLLSTPELLLLDEPLGGLDTYIKKKIVSFLNQLTEKKKATIIYVTHSTAEASWINGVIRNISEIKVPCAY